MTKAKEKPKFSPDFIIIPRQLIEDRELDQTQRLLYGYIYWYTQLKDGKCTASNVTLAELLFTTTRVIQNAMTILEKRGYITREYKDEAKRNRKAIHTNIAFGKVSSTSDRKKSSDLQVTNELSTGDRHERPTGDQSNNIILKNKKKRERTPKDFSKEFFEKGKIFDDVLERIKNQTPKQYNYYLVEIDKFIDYWTEPMQSGKKVRWEMQKTFDVNRRLKTWMRRAVEYLSKNRSNFSSKNPKVI